MAGAVARRGAHVKPRVVHLRASNFLGGPERQLLGQARAARGAWYETVIASFLEGREHVDLLEAAADSGVRVLGLRSGGPFDPAPLAQLAQFAGREPVAAFVAHGYKAAAVCEIVSRMTGRPWLGAMRGLTAENRKVRSFESLELRLLRNARLAIAVSQGTADMLAERGIAPERIRVIPNSVDVDQWSHAGDGPPEAWVFSGRLSPEKNCSAALQALRQVPGARLKVAGDGPLRAALEAEAAALGVSDRVEFLGFCKDVRPLYGGSVGLLLPSLREGLPNAVLEALSAGLPVVASRVGGVPEVVRDGETGFLVEPGDVEGLAAAMRRVQADPAMARKIGAAGREWVRARFGFARQRELWDEALSDVVRRGPRFPATTRDRLKAGIKERLGARGGSAAGAPVILTFHRVVDIEDPLEESASCPWISLRAFETLLDRITREYEAVPLSDSLRFSSRGRPRVSLTFDDGWRDNLELAAPALAARGLPWTLFPATALAGTDIHSWQDRMWKGALELFREGERLPRIWRGVWPSEAARTRAELALQCQATVARLKRWQSARREEILATLPAALGGPRSRYLGLAELRGLHDQGVEIGSHTHTHPLLSQLEDAEARNELQHSAEVLREALGAAPASVAYPDGNVTPRVAELAREVGYRLGVTTREGRVEADANPLLLPRVDLSEERLMGSDGCFSYDRFRFELSRVR